MDFSLRGHDRRKLRLLNIIDEFTNECLAIRVGRRLKSIDAIESWRRHYNAVHPHTSIGYLAPAPEVFVPALAAWPAAQPRPAPPAVLSRVPKPTLN